MEHDQQVEPVTLNYASKLSPSPFRPFLRLFAVLVAVIGFPLLIAAFVRPSVHFGMDEYRNYTMAQMGNLTSPLELFHQAMGRYPRDLKEVYKAPPSPAEARKWAGPYIDSTDKLKDAWGREFQYKSPGVHNSKAYDLWSTGKDGEDGTSDDICNW